ncbi:hypothetical protein G7054_g7173 [Neopestalotiopsis clavispora]|nr:hypothetical protein G7054_g7173 [Neopestalotiopsis clavispora]
MATDISLTFINGGKQPRAAQIPRETWETHKRAIQELYTHFTLAEMMELMKTDYGFDATARQYTWKLRQWGLSKQWTGEEQDDDRIPKSTAGFDPDGGDESSPLPCGQGSENLKRPNSRQNNGSRSSQYSLDSTPISKRLKMASEEDTDDVSSSWNDENFSEPSHITSSEDSPSIASSIASHEIMPAKVVLSNESDSLHISSDQTFNIAEGEERSNPARETENGSGRRLQFKTPWSAPRLRSYVAQLLERTPTSRERPSSPEHLKRSQAGSSLESMDIGFCLDLAHNLEGFDTLSESFDLPSQVEERLKVVADRLFAVDQFQAASNIYSVLLVAEESETRQRTRPRGQLVPMLTPLMVAAFRSARTIPQCKLVHRVLLKRQDLHKAYNGSLSELFLVYQFLADCCSRQGLAQDRKNYLEKSWFVARGLKEVGDSQLERKDAVIFYLCYKNAFPELPWSKSLDVADMVDSSSRSGLLAAYGATPVGYDDFMAFCTLIRNTRQEEGTAPREDETPDRRILMCVRDCVTWCGSIRRDIDEEVSSLKRVQYIWDAWHGETTGPYDLPHGGTVQEIEFGISTTEHLYICDQIFSFVGGTKGLSAISYRELADLYFKFLFSRVSANLGQQPNQGMSNSSSRISLAPTIASSLGSSNASLRYFKYASQSIKERVVGVPSVRSRKSYDSESLSHMSHLSKMSHVTDLFGASSIHEEDETEASNFTHNASNVVED